MARRWRALHTMPITKRVAKPTVQQSSSSFVTQYVHWSTSGGTLAGTNPDSAKNTTGYAAPAPFNSNPNATHRADRLIATTGMKLSPDIHPYQSKGKFQT